MENEAYEKINQFLGTNFSKKLDKEDWHKVSMDYALSEDFIREFKDNVDWYNISMYQKLSENFIRDFKDSVYWYNIGVYQKLSESFINEFNEKLDWKVIIITQRISDKLTQKYRDKINLSHIDMYQTPSNLNWLGKSSDLKKNILKKTELYECHEDYFIAYKGIRNNRYSTFNFQHKYEKGKTYEEWCDTSSYYFGVGLYAWDEDNAKDYGDIVVKVKIFYDDIGRIWKNGKIRCFKLTILD